MKPIVLIDPAGVLSQQPFGYSLGLLRIAASLEAHGYEVRLVDDCSSIGVLIDRVIDMDPLWVGITTRCDTYPFAIRLAARLKEQAPALRVVFGGPHATATDVETLRSFPIDIIVRGEGEVTALELTGVLRNGAPLETVPGLTLWADGRIIRTGSRSPLSIRDLGMPAYHHLNLEAFRRRFLIPRVEAGRGCPYACVFCSTSQFWGRQYRLRTPSTVVEEITWLKNKYGFQHFDLVHDNLLANPTLSHSWLAEFAKLNPGCTWQASVRIDQISKESALLLYRAGCRSLFFGLESGSRRIQELIRKNIDLARVPEVLDLLGQYGIRFTASFIVGFPYETEDDICATTELALHIRKHPYCESVQLHKLCLLPGTPLWEDYVAKLRFDGRFSDQAATMLTEDDICIVKRYPRVFSQFYSVVTESPQAELVDLVSHSGSYVTNVYPRTLDSVISDSGSAITTVLSQLKERGFVPEVPYSFPSALRRLQVGGLSSRVRLTLQMEQTAEQLLRESVKIRFDRPAYCIKEPYLCLSNLCTVVKDCNLLPVLLWAIPGTPIVQCKKLDPVDLCIVEVARAPISSAEIEEKVLEMLPISRELVRNRIHFMRRCWILTEVTGQC